jgi:RNA polymerase sigma-70 factor (ECF subfamily)
MSRYDAGTTDPALLNRLGNWRDREAWLDFVTRYDPVIRDHARGYRLDAETTEELCQRVWIDVARRMRAFCYDPGKTFRGWLGRLCRSRAIDLLRQKQAVVALPLEDASAGWKLRSAAADIDAEEDAALERACLLLLAEEVQAAGSTSGRGRCSGTSLSWGRRSARLRKRRAFLTSPPSRPRNGCAGCSVRRESGSLRNSNCTRRKWIGP